MLEYSSNYSDETGSLWLHSKDQPATFKADIAYDKNNFKSFDYKAKLLGSAVAQTQRYYLLKDIIKNYNVIKKLLWPTHWMWYKTKR